MMLWAGRQVCALPDFACYHKMIQREHSEDSDLKFLLVERRWMPRKVIRLDVRCFVWVDIKGPLSPACRKEIKKWSLDFGARWCGHVWGQVHII